MSLQHAILGVLEARPMTGYELTRFFDTSARWVWSAPQSQIYPMLKRLEAAGFVAGQEQIRGEKLRRIEYSLTPAGLDNLRNWIREEHIDSNVRDPLLVKALLFDMVDAESAEHVLLAHIEELQSSIEQWAVHRDRLLARDTPLIRERLQHRPAAEHERIAQLKAHVFDYLIETTQDRIRWCQSTIDMLKDSPK